MMQGTDKKVTETQTEDAATIGRRKLLKALGATGGVVAASTLSVKWEAPFIELSKLAASSGTTGNAYSNYTHDHQNLAQAESKLTAAGGNDGQARELVANGVSIELSGSAQDLYVSTTGFSATSAAGDLVQLSASGTSSVGSLTNIAAGEGLSFIRSSLASGAVAVDLKHGESVRFDVQIDDATFYEIELLFYTKGTVTVFVEDPSKPGTDTRKPYLELHRLVKVTKS